MSSEAIAFVESRRYAPRLEFALSSRWSVQDMYRTETAEPAAGEVWTERADMRVPIARSEWLLHLRQMGWEDYQLFEIPRLPLVADKGLAEALQHLGEASDSLRNHDHDTVLFKCRKAFEAAAKYAGKGNTKAGFDSLCSRAFKDHPDKPKVYDDVIRSLSRLAHKLGRHAQEPTVQVNREDAEMMLATTVALFSAIGRGLRKEP